MGPGNAAASHFHGRNHVTARRPGAACKGVWLSDRSALACLVSHSRNRKQGVTDDTEKRSNAPYGEHVLLVACRKASTIGDYVADILPPAGQGSRQPAGCINDCKRDSRNDG